jgi:hypothetical protein
MVTVPLWRALQERPPELLTPEAVANHTFRANKFFVDQLIFSDPHLLANLSAVFEGRFYPPGALLTERGQVPTMLIIENGTAHIVPNNAEDIEQFKEPYRHGDAYGTHSPAQRASKAGAVRSPPHREGDRQRHADDEATAARA